MSVILLSGKAFRNQSLQFFVEKGRALLQHLNDSTLQRKVGSVPTNVLGTELKSCCRDPMTGFYRDGYCRTGAEDVGQHTVCVQATREFLDFAVLDGNDLVTPHPEWGFPGLEPGDRWCICVTRWADALEHNVAPPVDLEATHSSALEFVTLEDLKAHALK